MNGPMTHREAAAVLGHHISLVYRLLADGTLEGKQFNYVWMIDLAEVERVKAFQGSGGRLPGSVPEEANE